MFWIYMFRIISQGLYSSKATTHTECKNVLTDKTIILNNYNANYFNCFINYVATYGNNVMPNYILVQQGFINIVRQ